jgi:hypothetical protein
MFTVCSAYYNCLIEPLLSHAYVNIIIQFIYLSVITVSSPCHAL